MLEHFIPLLWCMRVVGLYHEPPPKDATWLRKIFSARTYCLIITTILWLNWMRYIPVFFIGIVGFNPFELLTFCWFLQGALNCTICFRACTNKDHLLEFSRLWSIFKREHEEFMFTRREMLKWLVGCMLFACFFIIVDFSMLIAGLADIYTRGQIWLNSYLRPFPHYPINYVLYFIMEIFLTSAWIFPFCLIVLSTIGLIKVTSNLRTAMEDEITFCQGVWPWPSCDSSEENISLTSRPPDVPKWRIVHLRICDMARQLDKDFCMILLTFSLVAVPKTCYITYNLIHTVASAFTSSFHIMNVYWFVFTVLTLIVIFMSANILHGKVAIILKLTEILQILKPMLFRYAFLCVPAPITMEVPSTYSWGIRD